MRTQSHTDWIQATSPGTDQLGVHGRPQQAETGMLRICQALGEDTRIQQQGVHTQTHVHTHKNSHKPNRHLRATGRRRATGRTARASVVTHTAGGTLRSPKGETQPCESVRVNWNKREAGKAGTAGHQVHYPTAVRPWPCCVTAPHARPPACPLPGHPRSVDTPVHGVAGTHGPPPQPHTRTWTCAHTDRHGEEEETEIAGEVKSG